jgi:DnaK suppressor protein
MKETVSKTAKKSSPAAAGSARKSAAAATALAEPITASSPAGAAKAKTTPASRAAAKSPGVAKAAAKAPRATSKTTPPEAAGAGSEETAAQLPVTAADSPVHTPERPGGTAELADKMKTSVVSKVSEVMTKTTKPNTAAQSEARLLTEDEIRTMGDDDYMKPAQLAFFKDRLQQLERDLLKNAGETTEHLRETVLVPDPADRATIEEEHALELRTRDRERKLLKKVQQSLASIEAGEYGWCEETGEPIGIPRLIARPTATLSLEAQQRRELKQKLYGD